MEIQVPIKVKPFSTPNFIIEEQSPGKRQDGFKEPRGFALKEVDAKVLSQLCDQFRAEIFRKAGKKDPRLE